MRIPNFVRFLALLVTFSMSTISMSAKPPGFWSMRADREWSASELDRAFDVFKRMKTTYGDQFNFVVQDLHKEGSQRADGAKTAQILIKIYVTPPNLKISKELEDVGMVYVDKP